MGIEDIKKDVYAAGKYISENASKATNYANMKMKLIDKQDILNKKFQELGRTYYEDNKGKMDFKEIDELMSEIESMKNEINSIKETKVCTKCGSNQDKNNIYCAHCGAKL